MQLIDAVERRMLPVDRRAKTRTWLARVARRRWFRAVMLAGLLVALELLLFEGWLRGSRVPPWDFLGAYAQEAYWWWSHGGFFDPVSWMPSVRGGYPASLSLQNSAWYLPYGAVAALMPLTPWPLAAIAAVHVAFGSVGAYLCVRRFGASYVAGLFAATGWFFAVGYFSNAEHPDIARGYAWLPWVLLIASTRWPWRRWWATPVAILLLWQATSGVYPGMLVAYAYVGVVWVVLQQWRSRPRFRDFLLPLGVAMVAAVLLSMIRLLPYALGTDVTGVRFPDSSEWSWSMLLTLQFGYADDAIPNDISMRAFFIPAAVLIAALFAPLRARLTQIGLALLVPAALLGLPVFPWFVALQQLPGLSLSRFTMSDFKVCMIFGVLLLAVSAVDGFIRSSEPLPGRRWRIIAAGVVVLLFAVGGRLLSVELRDYVLTLAVLAGSAVLVAMVSGRWRGLAALLIVAIIASGLLWAYSNRSPWRTDRADVELGRFGAPVASLIDDAAPQLADRRPARTPLPPGADSEVLQEADWNVAYYTGVPAVGGYLNLKGNPYFDSLRDAMIDGDRAEQLRAFLAAPGTAIDAAAFQAGCGAEECGTVGITPVAYQPGALEYRIEAPVTGPLVFNEPYYTGWSASVCSLETCEASVPTATTGLITLDVPAGESAVTLTYATPGLGIGWLLFWAGAVVAALAAAAPWFARRRQPTRDERGAIDA